MQVELRLGQALRTVLPCGWLCLWVALQVATGTGAFAPAVARAEPTLTQDALPGLVAVPAATESPLVAGAGTVGYAYTGDVLKLDDAHHQINYDAAASTSPLPQLQVAGGLGARIDTHKGVDAAGTSGFATYGHFSVRGRFEVREGVHLGLDVLSTIPASEDAKQSLKALTPEFNGMATYQTDRYLVSGALGARINRSDLAFRSGTTLSPYEEVALRETGDPQLLVGAGAGVAAGPVWCVVDFQFSPYLGSSAPAAKYAPALLGLGVRGDVRRWLQLGLHTQISATPYPPATAVGSVPVPPRISAQAFVALRWDKPEPEETPEPPAPEPEPVAPPEPTTTTLQGEVTGLHGHPIPDAAVHVYVKRDEDERSLQLPGGTSEFAVADLPFGDWQVRVEAKGYQPSSRTVRLPAPRPLQFRLDRELPPGHIEVRVQDFRGRQVEAQVVVLPDRTPFQPMGETGLYNLDLAPGEYEIEIVADGYAAETRTAVVAQNGVTIVVVDLRRTQEE